MQDKWKEKVQKDAQCPFCGQTKAFRYEIVFRGIQPCFRLDCFEPTKAARFLEKLEEHSVRVLYILLYDQRKVRFFKKGSFVFIKVSWTFSTF